MACRMVQRRQSEMRRDMARRQACRRGSIPTHFPSIPGCAFPKPIIERRLSRYDANEFEGGIKSLIQAISVGELSIVESIMEEIKDTVTLLNKDMFHVIMAAVKTGDPLIVSRVMQEVKARRYFPVRYLTSVFMEAIRTKNADILRSVKSIRPKIFIPEEDVVQLVFEAVNTDDPTIVLELVKSRHFKKKLSSENAFQVLTKALSSSDPSIISSVVSHFKPKNQLSVEHKLTILRYAIKIHHLQTVQFCFRLKSFLLPEDAKEILLAAARSSPDVFSFVCDTLHPILNEIPIQQLLRIAMQAKKVGIVQKIMQKFKILDQTLIELLLIHLRGYDPDENILIVILHEIHVLSHSIATEILSAIIIHDFLNAVSAFHWDSCRRNLPNTIVAALVHATDFSRNSVSEDTSENDIGERSSSETGSRKSRDHSSTISSNIGNSQSRDHSAVIQKIIFKCRSFDSCIVKQIIMALSLNKNIGCLDIFLGSLNNLSEDDAREVLYFVAQSLDKVDVVEILVKYCKSVSLENLDECIRRCQHDNVRQLLILHRRQIVTEQFRKHYGEVLKEVHFEYDSKKEITLVAIFGHRPKVLMSDFMSYSVHNKIMTKSNETDI